MTGKILIINQHKGEIKELLSHMSNFGQQVSKKEFRMVMVIDMEVKPSERTLIEATATKYNIGLVFNERNLGLSRSRVIAIQKSAELFPNDSFTHVVFGCTNSKYRNWDTTLAIRIREHMNPTLFECEYENDFLDRDQKILEEDHITFDTWFNTENKPDCTLMFPINLLLDNYLDLSISTEPYTPEDILMFNATRVNNRIDIFRSQKPILTAWYNSNGLSKTFNRYSITRNSTGFLKRATLLLEAYSKGEVILSYNRLKWLVYDYVTLSPSLDKHHIFKGTAIEPLIQWSLFHWVEDAEHLHRIKFIEN